MRTYWKNQHWEKFNVDAESVSAFILRHPDMILERITEKEYYA